MNFANFKIVLTSSKWLTTWVFFLSGNLFFLDTVQAWEVDFSRRQLEFSRIEDQNRMPASEPNAATNQSPLEKVFESVGPAKEIVILNTEKGFVPDTIQLRQGTLYQLHIVNVNDQKKNVSFVIDSFGEHHNTVYGRPKTFKLNPKAEGVFSYQCPETAMQGKIVVVPQERKPANVK